MSKYALPLGPLGPTRVPVWHVSLGTAPPAKGDTATGREAETESRGLHLSLPAQL